jgi:hypothetical protein
MAPMTTTAAARACLAKPLSLAFQYAPSRDARPRENRNYLSSRSGFCHRRVNTTSIGAAAWRRRTAKHWIRHVDRPTARLC